MLRGDGGRDLREVAPGQHPDTFRLRRGNRVADQVPRGSVGEQRDAGLERKVSGVERENPPDVDQPGIGAIGLDHLESAIDVHRGVDFLKVGLEYREGQLPPLPAILRHRLLRVRGHGALQICGVGWRQAGFAIFRPRVTTPKVP